MLDRVVERAWRVSSRLLAVEPVFAAVQRALSLTLSARQVVDRLLDAAWAAGNVPSHADVERLQRELADARATVAALETRLAALADALESRAPPPS